ncbi:MAG: LacI family DNA-binding transcriptional regulator [Caldilineaceae bacterium]|nr:LacI family DNA-binding transcriptional regulator [Caldilineaceae bacterium]
MPTMQDVARHAGVALSTVSYAINGTRPISEETRRRIFAAMDELGYRPNALARGLASKRSRIIALLFPAVKRGMGLTELEFVVSAADAARENGYHLVLWSTEIRDAEELQQLMRQGLVDGVVVMEIHDQDERIDLLRTTDFPFTMIGRCADNAGLNFIDIDFGQTMAIVIAHLVGLGHTHIGFLNHAVDEFEAGYGPAVRAQNRFLETVAANGLHGTMRYCEASPQAGYSAVNELRAADPDLTAVIAMNDRAVPGILRAIADQGLSIPDDFSVVAIVSSARFAEMMTPTITTAEAPAYELGRLGTEMLIRQLEGGNNDISGKLIPCKLVIRESSGESPARRSELSTA